MNPTIIKQKINELSQQGIPYLFAVNFELSDGFFLENPLEQTEILFKTPKNTNFNSINYNEVSAELALTAAPLTLDEYHLKFDRVMNALKRGDSFLANLTLKTPIETQLSLEQICRLSNAPYTIYVPNKFVCFSPERFVHISEGIISTNPMKGTIDANITNADKLILENKKERAEHHTIVDLLRNDLSTIAQDVCVKRFSYIDHIKTKQKDILQVSSEIEGKLEGSYLSQLGDLIFTMLPAGSISGAPKDSTIKIIQEAEGEPRGFYTGVFGYFDGKNLDSAVMIRYIEEIDGIKYFRSGGGITALSKPEDEYLEAIQKIYLPIL